MNVYAIKARGTYGGGMSVVAAHSVDEAKAIAAKNDNSMWNVRYDKPESVELLPLAYEGPTRVLAHYETGE